MKHLFDRFQKSADTVEADCSFTLAWKIINNDINTHTMKYLVCSKVSLIKFFFQALHELILNDTYYEKKFNDDQFTVSFSSGKNSTTFCIEFSDR